MKTRIYTFKNKVTGATREVAGIKDLAHAWRLVVPMSGAWGWHWADVVVRSPK